MIVALGGRRGIGWFDDIVDFVEDVADAPFDAVSHVVGKAAGTAGSIVKAGGKLGSTVLGVHGALVKQAASQVGDTYRTLRAGAVTTPGSAAAASAAGLPIAPPTSSNMPIVVIGVLVVGAALLLTRKKPAAPAAVAA